jgi:hypothetical protein
LADLVIVVSLVTISMQQHWNLPTIILMEIDAVRPHLDVRKGR